jgi:hypothetical protein
MSTCWHGRPLTECPMCSPHARGDGITFTEPSFLVWDDARDGACTDPLGRLAIFTTEAMARAAIAQTHLGNRLRIVPVMIKPASTQ